MKDDRKLVMVIDTREQAPLPVGEHITSGLRAGDYSFVGGEDFFAVERKSVEDLVGSLTRDRERFENECHRLRGYCFKRLLIVGKESDVWNHGYRSRAVPKAIMHSLYAFEIRYDLPFVFCAQPEEAGRLIRRWAAYYVREVLYKMAKSIEGGLVDGTESAAFGSGEMEH